MTTTTKEQIRLRRAGRSRDILTELRTRRGDTTLTRTTRTTRTGGGSTRATATKRARKPATGWGPGRMECCGAPNGPADIEVTGKYRQRHYKKRAKIGASCEPALRCGNAYDNRNRPPPAQPEPPPASGRMECCDAPTGQPEPTGKYKQRHQTANTRPCPAARRCGTAYHRSRYKPSKRQPQPHGTLAAAQRHYDQGDLPLCEPCRQARNEAQQAAHARRVAARRNRPKAEPTDTGRCGTRAGYQLHARRWETPCPECAEANIEYSRQLRKRTTTTTKGETP